MLIYKILNISMPNEYKSESLTCYENVSNLDTKYSKYFKSFVPIFIRPHTILQLASLLH